MTTPYKCTLCDYQGTLEKAHRVCSSPRCPSKMMGAT